MPHTWCLNTICLYCVQDKDRAEWKEKQLSSNTDSITLIDLNFGADYQLEVTAINANGSSLPVTFNFTIAEKPGNPLVISNINDNLHISILNERSLSTSLPSSFSLFSQCEVA